MNAGLYYGNQRVGTVRVATLDDEGNIILQEKSIIPTKQNQTVTPDDTYDGLSKVVISAIPSQYIDTTTSAAAAAADIANGKEAFVNGKKITGTHVCDTGADLSGVTATQNQILEGAITYVAGQENLSSGSLKNCSNTSLTVNGATVSIPTTGYYVAGQQASIPDQSSQSLTVNGATVSIPANGYYTTSQSASIAPAALTSPSATSAVANTDGSITISTKYVHGAGYNATASTRTGTTTIQNVLNTEIWTLTAIDGTESTLTVVNI